MAQPYLCAKRNGVPATERARLLSGRLPGAAKTWCTLTLANDSAAAIEAQITLGLPGQEYAGAWALGVTLFHS